MFSMSSTDCSSSNQEAAISAEMMGAKEIGQKGRRGKLCKGSLGTRRGLMKVPKAAKFKLVHPVVKIMFRPRISTDREDQRLPGLSSLALCRKARAST